VNLRRIAFSASRWTTASALFRVILQFAQTMMLARLLAPSDFGLMALVGAAVVVVNLVSGLGLGTALIHFPNPGPIVLSTLYWLNLGAAILLMMLFAISSWPLAALYEQPDLIPVVLLLSLSIPISALGQQFKTLAEKELRFSTLARIETGSALLGFIAAIAMASQGSGVYALVAALLVTAASNSIFACLYLTEGHSPRLHFCAVEALPFLRFGAYRLADALFNSLRMQADLFIGGLFVDPAVIGLYAVPRDMNLRVANTVINPVVTRVGLPIMSKVQSDPTALRSIYLQTLRMTASLNIPVYAVLAIFADEVVAILLGEQWNGAGFYFRLFAIWGMIRSLGNPVGSLLYAAGHVKRAFSWNLALLLLVPPALWWGAATGGTERLAWTMLTLQLMIFLPAWSLLVYPACGAGFRKYCDQIWPALIATGIACSCGVVISQEFDNEFLGFGAGLVVTAATYLAFSWKLNRTWVYAALEFAGVSRRTGERA
jgi:O-antigen/teichoic acid export membrane protein